MAHDCAAEGHRWGVRRGTDALSGRWFWACIECGHVDLGRRVPWAQILVRRLTAAKGDAGVSEWQAFILPGVLVVLMLIAVVGWLIR